jgi:hypothetical protein
LIKDGNGGGPYLVFFEDLAKCRNLSPAEAGQGVYVFAAVEELTLIFGKSSLSFERGRG